MVRAIDLARELNLSQSTVSRILSGDAQHRVSPATRKRVMDAARRMGYQPNGIARSLRMGRTHTIGLHMSHSCDARNPFVGTLIGAVQAACRTHRLDLMLHSTLHGSPAEELHGRLRDGRIDGLLLHATPDDPLVSLLAGSSLPVVAVADRLPGIPSVMSDDADGVARTIERLWQRGYRRYAFLAPEQRLNSAERRCLAFEEILRLRGAEAADVLRIPYEDAATQLEALRSKGPGLAVCCWNDLTAYRLLRACGQAGIRVPGELAVTGFDGFPDERLPSRSLVTVRCPWEEVAAQAVELLVRVIERSPDETEPGPETEIRLPVELLDGDTVGAVPAEEA